MPTLTGQKARRTNTMIDRRYKITQEQVTQMRNLRRLGNSYKTIGNQFGVSNSTALYWCDEKQRNNSRIRNAKKRKTGEALKIASQKDRIRRQERLKTEPKARLLHTINSMLSDKKTKRKSVYGIPKAYCIKLKDTGVLRTPNGKII